MFVTFLVIFRVNIENVNDNFDLNRFQKVSFFSQNVPHLNAFRSKFDFVVM